MITVNISSLKDNLSALLKKVKRGEEIIVFDRNHPVAKISSCSHLENELGEEDLLNHLEKKGVVQRASAKLPLSKWIQSHLVKTKGGKSAVRLLIEEREEGR